MNRLANTAILHLAVGLAVLLLEPITPRAAGCDQALTEPYLKLQSLSDPVVADCGTWRVQIETDRRDWFKGLSLEFVDSSGALPDVGFSIACSIALDRDGRLMSKTFAGRSRCPEALDQNPLMLRAFSIELVGADAASLSVTYDCLVVSIPAKDWYPLSGSDGSWCGDPDSDPLVGNGEGAAIVSVGVVIGLKGK